MDKKGRASTQIVILVDKNDQPTGEYAPRHKAHTENGLHHRAFVCTLFNEKGEILLQKRKHWLWDNLWDLSVISHPLHLEDHNETYEEATKRALKKELGIENVPVQKTGAFNYFTKHEKDDGCENEYCVVLVGKFNGQPTPDPEDIYETKWVNFTEFVNDVKKNPKNYTPWANLTILHLTPPPLSITL